jgi:hypothetical protein
MGRTQLQAPKRAYAPKQRAEREQGELASRDDDDTSYIWSCLPSEAQGSPGAGTGVALTDRQETSATTEPAIK